MKKGKSMLFPLILITLGMLLIVSGILLPVILKKTEKDRDDFYVVTAPELKYGISNSKGKLIEGGMVYTKISRGRDIVYLKNNNTSFLYNIKDGTKVMLDGMESDIIFPKNKSGEYMDKYILRFGADEKSSIYRIINAKGEKIVENDYASLTEAVVAIDANMIDLNKNIDLGVLGANMTVDKALAYLTEDLKYQYIVKNKTDGFLYGIIDEEGKMIVPLEYDKIDVSKENNTACLAIKDGKEYIIPASGKPIEIELGFEADISGEGYIIQKRGEVANKLYNLKGEVVINKIFNLPIKTITLNSKASSYLFISDGDVTWTMYDLNNLTNPLRIYKNINTEYLKNKKLGEISDSFIYTELGINYVVELDTFEKYKLGITNTIIAPLEPGYVLVTT